MKYALLVLLVLGAGACGFRQRAAPLRAPDAATAQTGTPKLTLTPAMVVNESALGDAGGLVDEQDAAGDPASGGRGGTPKTAWTAGWTAWRYPLNAFVDLGRSHRIAAVYLYDGMGTGGVTVSAGVPFAWKPLFTDTLGNYQQWNRHDAANVETRYLRVTIAAPGTNLPEIVVYGTPVGAAPAAAPRRAMTIKTKPTMDQFIGMNAFIDDPLERMRAAGFVREYHNWNWDEGDSAPGYAGYPKNENRFNPSAAGGGGWNFDEYYARLKRAGITVCPCIQGSTSWLNNGDHDRFDNKPVLPGKNSLDPAAYVAHADHLFQFIARYGSAKVPDARLKLAPGQPRKSGLNLLTYVENWNEQDKDWRGPDAYFSPYEFAAMSSADYDGHRGALGRVVGIKNADPNARLVMGGIAGLNLDYIKGIKVWSDHHRGGSFPLDVLNLHHYSNTGGEQQKGAVGISPEADRLASRLRAFVTWRDANLPDVEVWITEFGYDTNPASPQRAPAIGPYDANEVQAQWLVRSYLALAASGVDRAAMYMLRDVDPASTTQFSSSGLVTQKGAWTPKPAWWYVATLKNRLAGMRWAGEQPSGDPNVRVYKFKSALGPGGAYAVWRPTSDGAAATGYRLVLPAKATRATRITLTTGRATGEAAPLSLAAGNKATLAVSERPLLVLVDRIE